MKSGMEAKPNEAHLALAKLDEKYDTLIITQNIENLHEKAGPKVFIHLHGEIVYASSCPKYLLWVLTMKQCDCIWINQKKKV